MAGAGAPNAAEEVRGLLDLRGATGAPRSANHEPLPRQAAQRAHDVLRCSGVGLGRARPPPGGIWCAATLRAVPFIGGDPSLTSVDWGRSRLSCGAEVLVESSSVSRRWLRAAVPFRSAKPASAAVSPAAK
jgi:hypothetical protein